MSTTLHELRTNLVTVRETHGRRSSQAEQAFSELVRAAATNGTPLDGLRHHTVNEVERFFSWTIAGVDGHVYWDGPNRFVMNNGHEMKPRRWWFKHVTGTLDKGQDLGVQCGEKSCINPEHMAIERLRGYKMRWTDERAISAFQVVVMRLGYTPTNREWDRRHFSPSSFTLSQKFGGWFDICRRAGVSLPARTTTAKSDPESVLEALRFAKRLVGNWPTRDEFEKCRQQLHDAGLPSSATTVRKTMGVLWKDCLDLAGREAGAREETPTRNG